MDTGARRTGCRQQLAADCGLQRAEQLLDHFYAQPDRRYWAGRARVVFELAVERDPAARRIVAAAADALTSLARGVGAALGIGPGVLAGGLAVHQPVLQQAVRDRLNSVGMTDVRVLAGTRSTARSIWLTPCTATRPMRARKPGLDHEVSDRGRHRAYLRPARHRRAVRPLSGELIMQVVIVDTPAEVGRVAAAKITSLIRRRADAVLGLATGSSPLAIYAELARQVAEEGSTARRFEPSPSTSTSGCPPSHPESYRSVIGAKSWNPRARPRRWCTFPTGRRRTWSRRARRTSSGSSEVGPVDIQILGIGSNGHIGFNEPLVVRLPDPDQDAAPKTRADNARFFASPDEVPTHCLTQGLGTILGAETLLLVAKVRRRPMRWRRWSRAR